MSHWSACNEETAVSREELDCSQCTRNGTNCHELVHGKPRTTRGDLQLKCAGVCGSGDTTENDSRMDQV